MGMAVKAIPFIDTHAHNGLNMKRVITGVSGHEIFKGSKRNDKEELG